ncbi:MAG: peptidoglycan DD-metalloendopeptidase family protein [Nodosilinea sp.]
MLGIALSFGATAPLLTEPELALAAEGPMVAVLPSQGDRGEPGVPQLMAKPVDDTATAYHTVEAGESLWKIAKQHQADVQEIEAANGIATDEILRVGQVIRVPTATPSAAGAELALESKLEGGVGGDWAASGIQAARPTVLSVHELEQAWASADVATLPLENLEAVAGDSEAAEASTTSTLVAASRSGAVTAGDLGSIPAQPTPATAPAAQPVESASSDLTAAVGHSQPGFSPAIAAAPVLPAASPWQDSLAQPGDGVATGGEAPAAAVALAPAATSTPEVAPATQSVPAAGQPQAGKPAQTLWSASRHGLSPVQQPESAAPPSSIDAAAPAAAATATPAAAPTASASLTPPSSLAPASDSDSRDQAIRDHLARIREASGASVDREVLNARIRQARDEIARSRGLSTAAGALPRVNGEDAPALAQVVQAPARPVQSATASIAALPLDDGVEARSAALVAKNEPSTAALWTVTDAAESAPTTTTTFTTGVASPVVIETAPASPTTETWAVTDVADDTPVVTAALSADVIAPEATVDETAETVVTPVANADSTLLAAAPLGVEVYEAFPSTPTGQTVSPNMPLLPGADEFLPDAPNRFNGYIWPTQGTFTSGYGQRWGRMHRGIDVAAPVGTPVVAAADGVVVSAGWNSGGYGNMVDIRHPDGSLTRYAHNNRLLVRSGEQVRQGQQISEMGSTGYSTGPHLHFEVHIPNTGTVNPMAYLPSR